MNCVLVAIQSTNHGMTMLGAKHGVPTAPFFIVQDEDGKETIFTSVLQLVRERLGQTVTTAQHAAAIDVDDLGI